VGFFFLILKKKKKKKKSGGVCKKLIKLKPGKDWVQSAGFGLPFQMGKPSGEGLLFYHLASPF
jgi:hypothetical protein